MKLQILVVAGLAGLFSSPLLASFQYEGERNAFNRFHGHGKFTSVQGVVYEGSWVDGRREGQGVEIKPDGERYEGTWSNNRENGKGAKTWPNGDRYEGDWVSGKRQGNGILIKANGERYSGGFGNDERNGNGVLTLPSGDVYEGTFKAGKRSGEFKVKLRDGSLVVGQWNEDRAPATAVVSLPDGVRYTGPVRNGVQPNGKGSCVKAGKTESCEYADGKRMEAAAVVAAPAPRAEAKAVSKPVVATAAAVAAMAKPATSVTSAKPPVKAESTPQPGLRPDGTRFYFRHNFSGSGISDNLTHLKVEKDLNEFGAMRISANGGDFAVTLLVDEYIGAGTYELKYFKAGIEQTGESSWRTSAAEPGTLVVLKDDGKQISGTFSFTGYPNGNPGPDKRVISEGAFTIRY